MSAAFDLKTGRADRLERAHLDELALWHRQHGLALGFSANPDAVVTLNGFAHEVVSDLLVLAMIGLRTRTVAEDEPGSICATLCDEGRFDFERIFR